MHFNLERTRLFGATALTINVLLCSVSLGANASVPVSWSEGTEASYRYNGRTVKLAPRTSINPKGSIQVTKGKVFVSCRGGREEINSNNARNFKKISDLSNCAKSAEISQGEAQYPKSRHNDINVPYLVSPRYTLLSSNRPTLRWKHVENATSYTVQLYAMKAGREKSQPWGIPLTINVLSSKSNIQDVLGIKIFNLDYPNREPLQKGVKYHLVVQANIEGKEFDSHELLGNNQYSSLFGVSTSRPVDNKAHLQFKLYEKDISLDGLPKTGQINELDRLGFHSEAIQELERLIAKEPSPSIYRHLALIYAKIGLEDLSKRSLQAGIKGLENLSQKEHCEIEVEQIQQVLSELNQPQQNPLKCTR